MSSSLPMTMLTSWCRLHLCNGGWQTLSSFRHQFIESVPLQPWITWLLSYIHHQWPCKCTSPLSPTNGGSASINWRSLLNLTSAWVIVRFVGPWFTLQETGFVLNIHSQLLLFSIQIDIGSRAHSPIWTTLLAVVIECQTTVELSQRVTGVSPSVITRGQCSQIFVSGPSVVAIGCLNESRIRAISFDTRWP